MLYPYRLLFFIIFSTLMMGSTYASDTQQPLTVVELFTSQGCYSCPPADSLLGEIKHRDNTIAIACHVTYWNYLGWKDTFSKEFCDQRQRRYQAYLQGRAGVYTPQMIINGAFATVGSHAKKVERLIDHARTQQPLAKISITQTSKQLMIDLPTLANQSNYQLLLLGTSGEHHLPISKGENSGKTLTYHNPVTTVEPLTSWQGNKKSIKHTPSETHSVKEWIVIAQESPLGKIVAAGKLPL